MTDRAEGFPAQQDVYDFNERPEVAPHTPRDAQSALDVGCGQGGFGATLRAVLGPEARIVGIEPVRAQAHRAVSRGFDAVICDYFPPQREGLGRFDLVSFNDVLEHLVDPWQTLSIARDWLTPSGHVLAAIPDLQYWPAVIDLLNGRFDYTETGLLDRTHLRFFTRRSVLDLFDRAGFEVVTCVGANSMWGMEWKPAGRGVRERAKAVLRGRLASARPDGQFLHYVVLARPRHSGEASR